MLSAKNVIIRNLNILIQRSGENNVNQEQFQALVLNLAYLHVMKQRRKGIAVNQIEVLKEYADSACELIPETPNLMMTLGGYMATLQWDGLWDFLREYFLDKLGIAIDNVSMIGESFNSSFHRRYENGHLTSEDYADRIVSIQFSDDKKECLLRISPTLSDKKAYLYSIEERQHIYNGTDPDYKFIIYYDRFGSIERFSLVRTDRDLRIDYYE